MCEVCRVLIVDDDDVSHVLVEKVISSIRLKDYILRFDYAFSGGEAVEKISKRHYCIIILDISMESKTSGLDIVEFIRKNDVSTRIIIRTGNTDIPYSESVLINYDIHTYIDKFADTIVLKRSVISAIRSHTDIIKLQKSESSLQETLESYEKQLTNILEKFSKFKDTLV